VQLDAVADQAANDLTAAPGGLEGVKLGARDVVVVLVAGASEQMAANGSVPKELARTKPYGYSLSRLDVMSRIAQVLSTPSDNLWTFATPDGRGMRRALEYACPDIADKHAWPLPLDVMYFDQWPIRQPSLLFGGFALHEP
jgi:hypothetical protein